MFSVFSVFSVVKKFEPQKHTEKSKDHQQGAGGLLK
jgi:hypothetical protein